MPKFKKLLLAGLLAASVFSPSEGFRNGEQGAHFEVYDPNTLLRRTNSLTYTRQFDHPNWIKSNCSVSLVGSEWKIVEAATNTTHNIAEANVVVVGQAAVASARLKAGERTWAAVGLGNQFAFFDLVAGTVGVTTSNCTPSIAPAADDPGYFDCTIVLPSVPSSTGFNIYACSANNTSVYAGDGVSGIYVRRAQVNPNTVALAPYQLVTDWNSEYIAAALDRIALWQDTNSRSPVTAVEQFVGLWLDTKLGIVRSANRALNGGFDTDTVWAKGAGVTIDGGKAQFAAAAVGYPRLTQTGLFGGSPASKSFWVTYTISDYVSGSVRFLIGGGAGAYGAIRSANGTYSEIITTASTVTTDSIDVYVQSTFTGSVDDISIQELPGNHATQATGSARLVLRARYNQAIKNEQMADAAWSKFNATVTGNAATSPDGQQNAALLYATATNIAGAYEFQSVVLANVAYKFQVRLKYAGVRWANIGFDSNANRVAWFDLQNGVVGSKGSSITSHSMTALDNGWYLCEVTFTHTSNAYSVVGISDANGSVGVTLNDTNGAYVWGADIRTANDAALNQPTYQRVNTSTDYDTAGFIHYLQADGSDDGMQTAVVNFAGLTKMLIVAGVTKLNDSVGAGVIVEVGPTGTGTDGTTLLAAPASAGGNNYGSFLRNVTTNQFGMAPYAPPSSNIVCTQLDIAAATGAEQNAGTVDATSHANPSAPCTPGAFTSQAINLFRRNGGASVCFNGRVTSITLVASSTPASARFVREMKRYAARLAGENIAIS